MGNVSSSRSRSNSSPGLIRKLKEKALKPPKSRLRKLSTSSSNSNCTSNCSSNGGGGGVNDSSTYISQHSDHDLTNFTSSSIKKTSLDIIEPSSRRQGASAASTRQRRYTTATATTNDQQAYASIIKDPIKPSEFKKFFAENYIDNHISSSKKKPQTTTRSSSANQQQRQQLTRAMSLKPKTNPIYEDYVISKTVLGLGISGKVLGCVNKQTKQKYALKTLRESLKAKREIDLHWRACQSCPYIVQIVDVYENTINTQKVILVVMEWYLLNFSSTKMLS
jgi:hypothetical protein